jgi:hypothetical protein
LKVNISFLIIAILAIVILCYMQCGRKKSVPSVSQVIRVDTTYLPGDTVYTHDTPKLISSTPGKVPDIARPSKNYDSLLLQYNVAISMLYALNHYADTVFSTNNPHAFVVLDESVAENKIMGRDVLFNIPERVITKTVDNTVTLPLRRKIFIGGGIGSIGKLEGMTLKAGFLYENRKENIIGIHAGVNNLGQLLCEGSAYWKISFRKKQ